MQRSRRLVAPHISLLPLTVFSLLVLRIFCWSRPRINCPPSITLCTATHMRCWARRNHVWIICLPCRVGPLLQSLSSAWSRRAPVASASLASPAARLTKSTAARTSAIRKEAWWSSTGRNGQASGRCNGGARTKVEARRQTGRFRAAEKTGNDRGRRRRRRRWQQKQVRATFPSPYPGSPRFGSGSSLQAQA